MPKYITSIDIYSLGRPLKLLKIEFKISVVASYVFTYLYLAHSSGSWGVIGVKRPPPRIILGKPKCKNALNVLFFCLISFHDFIR